MQAIKHNIGARVKLPVQSVVTVKGKKSYVVRYGDILARVPLFDWQENEKTPKEILCRLQSINAFGFPVFEQVAQQEVIPLVEKPMQEKPKEENKSAIKSFWDRYKKVVKPGKKDVEAATSNPDVAIKEKPIAKIDVQKADISGVHNITYYRWASQQDSFEKWFISTGGIKRRYKILISLAKQLSNYHRINKVYKDLVPEYINVELSKDESVIVSIPETNYAYSGLGNVFIYASHSAPEVVNRRMPNTPMSDCYSFAVLVHELLAFCHPFVGDKVEGNSEFLAQAFKGRYSWIDDIQDPSNRLTRRYFDSFFTTKTIRELFKRTFVDGKESPMDRPSMFEWLDAIQDAYDHLKFCPHCNTDYLFYKEEICPFCDEEPTFPVKVELSHLDKKWDKKVCRFSEDEMEVYDEPAGTFVVNCDTPLFITSQHLLDDSINIKDILSIQVTSADNQNISLALNPLNGYSFIASTINQVLFADRITKRTIKSFKKNDAHPLVLSLKELNTPQRVIVIKPNPQE